MTLPFQTKLCDKREAKVLKKRDAAALRAQITGQLAESEAERIPRSMIIHIGSVGLRVKHLETDLREVMLPYTAKDLQVCSMIIQETNVVQVKKKNVFKDFLTIAGPIGVSHILTFTKSEKSINLRLSRLPQGPTLHFRG